MPEGGLYRWKLQNIRQPKNGRIGTCEYADLSEPLPEPPDGQTWIQDASSREWQMVPVATATVHASEDGDAVTAVAVAMDSRKTATTATTAARAVRSDDATTATMPTMADAQIQYHEVLPTDTFPGICLRYRVTPMELRRANGMLGMNLKLAPAKLRIPANDNKPNARRKEPTKEEKIANLLSRITESARAELSYSELRAYLEIADWDVTRAIADVNDDFIEAS